MRNEIQKEEQSEEQRDKKRHASKDSGVDMRFNELQKQMAELKCWREYYWLHRTRGNTGPTPKSQSCHRTRTLQSSEANFHACSC